MENTKATVEWNGRRITLEGPEEFVHAELERFTHGRPKNAGEQVLSTVRNEAQFVEQKKPRGHHEKVAVLAFWLTQAGQSEFTKDDVRKAYIRAGIRQPKAVQQAIRDAKNKFGYVDAGKARGKYSLTSHGADFVRFDLPRKQEST